MLNTLNAAGAKDLKELFSRSGKRIAVYSKPNTAWPQVLACYQNEVPPTAHPNHPDFTFEGWLDYETGAIRPDVQVDASPLGARPAITGRMILMALLNLLIMFVKLWFVCAVALCLIIGMFAGMGGRGRSGGFGKRH